MDSRQTILVAIQFSANGRLLAPAFPVAARARALVLAAHRRVLLRAAKAARSVPVRKVPGGYRYGTTGKVYKKKSEADLQGRAIRASQGRVKKRKGK